MMASKEYGYSVFFAPAVGGGNLARVPAIAEIFSKSDSREKARTMAADTIRCIIESNLRRGEPIPKDVAIDLAA